MEYQQGYAEPATGRRPRRLRGRRTRGGRGSRSRTRGRESERRSNWGFSTAGSVARRGTNSSWEEDVAPRLHRRLRSGADLSPPESAAGTVRLGPCTRGGTRRPVEATGAGHRQRLERLGGAVLAHRARLDRPAPGDPCRRYPQPDHRVVLAADGWRPFSTAEARRPGPQGTLRYLEPEMTLGLRLTVQPRW